MVSPEIHSRQRHCFLGFLRSRSIWCTQPYYVSLGRFSPPAKPGNLMKVPSCISCKTEFCQLVCPHKRLISGRWYNFSQFFLPKLRK